MNYRLAVGIIACHLAGAVGLWRVEDVRADAAEQPGFKHVIVYAEPGKFCGFPANAGAWSWGREILVGFHLAGYEERDRSHSTSKNAPTEIVQARSLNGGLTWTLERPGNLKNDREPKKFTDRLNFKHPDFALRCAGGNFQFSYNRGKTWSDFYGLPEVGGRRLLSRTDYLVTSKDECLVFLAATKTDGREGRPYCLRARNGGRTMEFVSWMTPEPPGFAIMPSTVRISKTSLVSAIRRKENGQGFIEIYASPDDGRTWTLCGNAAATGRNNGNPPSMVRLNDGRLVLTYGYRSEPFGIRAKASLDSGRTWGPEVHLRDDGGKWDLGYPRTLATPDGTLVTIYYFTTAEHREQHIAATIWSPTRISSHAATVGRATDLVLSASASSD